MTTPRKINERWVVLLIAGIHFVNILEFMIVMPLGPDFVRHLGIPADMMGVVVGSYTAAAAVMGIAGTFFLDRFDRRRVLAVCMGGLAVATAAAGLAWDMYSLIGARLLAGLFGGPATAVSLAIISDVVAPSRRGRAMSTVMSAFAVSSIAGVPLALELANVAGWRAPFFAAAFVCAVVTVVGVFLLPPLRGHIEQGYEKPSGVAMFRLLRRPLPLLAFGGMTCMMFSAFLLIPHIPNYLVFNLGYQGEPWLKDLLGRVGYTPSVLGPLYMAGGLLTLVVLQVVGRLTDRLGSAFVSWVGAAAVITVIYFWFIDYSPVVPALLLFVLYMGSMSIRGVPARTLDTKVPDAHERAAFMSLQNSVQHISLAGAAALSSVILTENADLSLNNMAVVAWIAVGFAVLLPVFVMLVERRVRHKESLVSATRVMPAGAPVTAPADSSVSGGQSR